MLRILSEKKQRAFYEQHLRTARTVLFEGENRNGAMVGFTDNYIKVTLPFDEKLVNSLRVCNLVKLNEAGICLGSEVEEEHLQPAG